MNNIDYFKYDMRDDFEVQVYVSSYLSKGDNSGLYYIKLENSMPGTIIKKNNVMLLKLSQALIKPEFEDASIIIGDSDKVKNQEDLGILYATTWDGSTQFIVRQYFKTSGGGKNITYNSISYGETGNYQILDMSIATQFKLSEKIYKTKYYFDYIHEWFSIYSPKMNNKQMKKTIIEIKNLYFENEEFDLVVSGISRSSSNHYESNSYANTDITVKFKNLQNREIVFKLGIQLRNFFQLLLNKDLGLYKIQLNRNKSRDNGDTTPEDERENWFKAQSFLPKIPDQKINLFDIKYYDIKDNFEDILNNFMENKKLQDFISRYLTVSQYKMPITPVLLTLCSGVESYLRGEKFSDGTKVKNFENKLNKVFNGTWEQDDSTKDIIQLIKNNRDYYIHGDKPQKKLTEGELIPTIIEFEKVIRNYILSEMGITNQR
ncbi:hypothetical protein C9I44_05755 [Lactococcus garvieae]|uniref:HEPN domain-containing protein n=2 Tax=Streptococcaceae TaxID=1300 RepID=UPI000EC8A070|nr:HEPN domain-containing protein [Lactococcus garvieae]UHU65962.1 hypothetical protein C9I44_05755 [Lactococcus garvieae]HCS86145.1 hypothetical protein [Lactococcus garvieae]